MLISKLRAHPIAVYFGIAFAVSWAAVLAVVAPAGFPAFSSTVNELIGLAFLAMLLGPSIASVSLTTALDGSAGLRELFGRFSRWRLGRWYLYVLVAPASLLLLGLLGLISSAYVPGVLSVSDKTALVLLALGYGLGAGFFEELGWTGFALPRMQQRYGVIRAGLLLGVMWGLWHLLASYWGAAQSWGGLYVPYYVVWCIGSFTGYRVLMAWAYSRTGSLLLAQLMHAGFTGGQALLSPPLAPGLPTLLWYAAFAAILWGVVGVVVMPAAQRSRAARALLHPASSVAVVVALCGLFVLVLEPWLLNWGSTREEQTMSLPGDTAEPSAYLSRAITIDGPPAEVWPWLLQIGQDRAGFYSNDWLENLTTADIHNADDIRPEWQHRAVGDKIPMGSAWQTQMGGAVTLLTVRILEPDRVIGDIPGRFVLLPIGDRATRLLLRERLAIPERAGLSWVIWDPMHFVMEQRMLQGIKERVEGRPLVLPAVQTAAHVGWAIAGVGLLAIFASRQRWWLWLSVPLAVSLPAVVLTGDLNAALAAFLAIGITVAGALALGWRWWPVYLLLASAVALTLLLTPDPFSAFGVLFLALAAVVPFGPLGHYRVIARQPLAV